MLAENIVRLCPQERVKQDAEPIASIYRNLGTASADQVVTRALAELAMSMAGLVGQVRRRDLADLSRQLRRLQAMGENLGMITFSTVAGHARECLERGDATAFSAVWARLVRIAERSLMPDGHLLDRSSS